MSIGVNQAIPLGSNFVSNGTAITHTPGSTDITLAPNQTYQACYTTKALVNSVGDVAVDLVLNGTTRLFVTGAISGDTPGKYVTLSGCTILGTTIPPNTLQLVNLNNPTTYAETQVSVVKLA
ncbi:hypothetical protein ACE3NQ_29105 [Paenibacillus terreus]|uniref:BclA C-terminal domain-containing protein n=2 Tax=Paenibacillus terreus TaxID=1387834 RepID=A0ABV5BH87_9BACL